MCLTQGYYQPFIIYNLRLKKRALILAIIQVKVILGTFPQIKLVSSKYKFDYSIRSLILKSNVLLVAEKTKAQVKKDAPTKEEPSSLFQRQRVDMLLSELLRKFPPPIPQQNLQQNVSATTEKTDGTAEKPDKVETKENSKENSSNNLQIKQEPIDPSSPMDTNMSNVEVKQEITTEIMKAPPEKKMKL